MSENQPTIDVGILISPHVTAVSRETFAADLAKDLTAKYAQVGWNVILKGDRLVDPPSNALDILEAARDRMLDENWDVVIVLTDLPLKDGRRVIQTQISPVHGVGLVVVPAIGVVQTAMRVRRTCLALVEDLLDFDDDDSGEEIVKRARQRSQDVDAREDESGVQFAARVLGGNVGVLIALIRANKPISLALRLSRVITVTAATAALLLITSDMWVLATTYGPVRLIMLSFLAVSSVTLSLIIGAQLWEIPRRRGEREQVVLFNIATAVSLLIGVTAFYLMVFGVTLAGAYVIIEGRAFHKLTGWHFTTWKLISIAWMTTSLATVGGAVGAGLEDDDVIRSAAYTREPAVES